ncbi:dihydroneopterin triphosphate diphosphatase [Sulfuriferula nivalis]|uniref:NUDIX pyrophosphatase n=1 Tax=Sulfuriferula nivalis TaxID=2675298 RepID=A0A809SEB2_9PROT|nr:dihydroneopterin triphosphate diphosphatase [Sulfuriferula nivalis]BBP01267.1 NUDIX pyrophosphatase [Sulfuriferula nivalis]
MPYKTPISVLVVIHTPDLQVLLLERADNTGWWQSVTGSQEANETPVQTAIREVAEETGLDTALYQLNDLNYVNEYEIYPRFRHRYAPGITQNTEHVFSLTVPAPVTVTLAEREHLRYIWLPASLAAQRCFSPSNQAAILQLLGNSDD